MSITLDETRYTGLDLDSAAKPIDCTVMSNAVFAAFTASGQAATIYPTSSTTSIYCTLRKLPGQLGALVETPTNSISGASNVFGECWLILYAGRLQQAKQEPKARQKGAMEAGKGMQALHSHSASLPVPCLQLPSLAAERPPS